MIVGCTAACLLRGADPTLGKFEVLWSFGSVGHSIRVGPLVESERREVQGDVELLKLIAGLSDLEIPSVPVDPLIPVCP